MLCQENKDSTADSLPKNDSSPEFDPNKLHSAFEPSQVQDYSPFTVAPKAMMDPYSVLALSQAFNVDKNPNKVNLSIGAYRDEQGEPYLFPVVHQTESELVAQKLDKEYLPISGNADFLHGARGVLLGFDHEDVSSGRVVSAQTLSGNGAIRVICEFLKQTRGKPVYVSDPTWANHVPVMKAVGLETREYRYFNAETKGLDFDGMIADLSAADVGSTVMLHTCAHNPTGVDPTLEQWKRIADVCEARNLFPFFDTAYQGFVSGDIDKDGASLRYFVSRGFELATAQSFSKIMGLYGERCGAAHFILNDKSLAPNVLDQVKYIIRTMTGMAPKHCSRIAATILNNEEKRAQWLQELVGVTQRIQRMRQLLKQKLNDQAVEGNWDHITDQIGMFSFTGLSKAQSLAMVEKHHVYMAMNGRISIAGLNESNVEYVAQAIKDVTSHF